MSETLYDRNRRILAEFILLCERYYDGALGPVNLPRSQTRIALAPLDLAKDFEEALRRTFGRLSEPLWRSIEEGP